MSASWGTGVWGIGTWGVGNIDETVIVTGIQLQTTINFVSIKIDNDTSVTGEQLNVTLNTVTLTADSNLTLSTNLLQTTLGNEDSFGNADVTLTTLNSLNTTIGPYSITADGNTSEIVVGDSINSTTGIIDASAGHIEEVIGQTLTITLGNETLTGDGSVILSTNLLNVVVGTAGGDVADIILTGLTVLTTSDTVSFSIDGSVAVTGLNMTTSTGRLFISAWAVVDIGVTNTWSVVDIAA